MIWTPPLFLKMNLRPSLTITSAWNSVRLKGKRNMRRRVPVWHLHRKSREVWNKVKRTSSLPSLWKVQSHRLFLNRFLCNCSSSRVKLISKLNNFKPSTARKLPKMLLLWMKPNQNFPAFWLPKRSKMRAINNSTSITTAIGLTSVWEWSRRIAK